MSSWLERYRQGEYEQVYNELCDLGDQVRNNATLMTQADAVAQEMMERARHNIALIIERLRSLDYRFRTEHEKRSPFDGSQLLFNILGQAQQRSAELSPGLQSKLNDIQEIMSRHMSAMAQELQQNTTKSTNATPKQPIWIQPDKASRTELTKFDRDYAMPLTLRAWFRIVGQVDLSGAHPKLSVCNDVPDSTSGPVSDPLVLWFDSDGFRDMQEDEDAIAEGYASFLDLAPDALHKAAYSGGGPLIMKLPCHNFDGLFDDDCDWPNTAFIPYLRECFRWGGFPGLRHDATAAAEAREELAFLTQDLLPL